MREIVHLQAGQCGNQIGAKVRFLLFRLIHNVVDITSRERSINVTFIVTLDPGEGKQIRADIFYNYLANV